MKKAKILTATLLIVFTFACNKKSPSEIILGEWIWYPYQENYFKLQFYKDGTVSAVAFNEYRNYTRQYQGNYKFINDETSLSFDFTFDGLYYAIEEKKPSVVKITRLDNDSLIINNEYIHGKFARVKKK